MRLATASAVLQSMGIIENPGSLANARQSLELSYSISANLLESDFRQVHIADYFDTDSGDVAFRTHARFLDKDTVVVRTAINGLPLLAPADGELLDPSQYLVNADLGTITLCGSFLKGKRLLSVAYDAGLPVSDEDDEVLDGPQWLRDAAIASAIHVQNTMVSSPANRKEKTVQAVSNEIRSICSQLYSSHKRPRMTVQFPALTIIYE